MNASTLPRHIAIIMDGNGRWANQRHLPRIAGHKAGADAVRRTVRACVEKKIEVLTLFAFSSENWVRPKPEITYLMNLFLTVLRKEIKRLQEQNIRLIVIGDRARFDAKLQFEMQNAEELTKHNTGLKLVIAANYGGRWDICQAVKNIVVKVMAGELDAEQVTAELMQDHIALGTLPEPDLLIRTSGEQRISNFLLWQLAYTEMYFTDIFWPDFNADELDKALTFFGNRERRFGQIGSVASS